MWMCLQSSAGERSCHARVMRILPRLGAGMGAPGIVRQSRAQEGVSRAERATIPRALSSTHCPPRQTTCRGSCTAHRGSLGCQTPQRRSCTHARGAGSSPPVLRTPPTVSPGACGGLPVGQPVRDRQGRHPGGRPPEVPPSSASPGPTSPPPPPPQTPPPAPLPPPQTPPTPRSPPGRGKGRGGGGGVKMAVVERHGGATTPQERGGLR